MARLPFCPTAIWAPRVSSTASMPAMPSSTGSGPRSQNGPSAITAFFMTCGPTAAVDPESFVHSKYIILWAINTISTNLHHWPFIAEAQRRGAKVVVVDPVSTRTAKKADWHVRIRPGTDAALALGMMNVIIAEGLVDRDYVDKYTIGYEDLK